MELELRRESLRRWETVARAVLEQEETAEAIVPDALPDIWQVLEGTGSLYLQRKEPQEGKAELAAVLKVTVLYQPEGAETGLESMEVTLPVTLTPDLPQVTRRCVLGAEPRVLSVDVHLLNPRKILVRTGWQVELSAYLPTTLSLAAFVQEGETYGLRQRTDTVRCLLTVGVQEKAFAYSDSLALPAGRPGLAGVLAVRGEVTCTEAKVIGTKLVFKGDAVLNVLCKGEDGSLFSEEFRIPYSQLMDAGEEGEDALATVKLCFTEVKCLPDQSDSHALKVDLTVQAQGILEKEVETPVLADLYSTEYAVQTQMAPTALATLLGRGEGQENLRATLDCPGLETVLDAWAFLGRSGQRQEGEDRVLVQEVRVLLLGQGAEGFVALGQTLTAEHRLSGVTGPVVFCCHLPRAPGAVILGEGAEMTLPVNFTWAAVETGQVPLVDSVTLGDKRQEEGERPSVILRAVRPGETLWDVAKACLSTEGRIMEASGLTTGEVFPGEMLLIPRT